MDPGVFALYEYAIIIAILTFDIPLLFLYSLTLYNFNKSFPENGNDTKLFLIVSWFSKLFL